MSDQITIADVEGEPFDSMRYRQAIGCLIYLAVATRPDISFTIGRLAQFVERPTRQLSGRVKRVFRYIWY